MSPDTAAPSLSVEACFERMAKVLSENPDAFAAVGGDVAFYVRDARPPWWTVTSFGGRVVIQPGNPPFPKFSIGIIPEALAWFVEGSLDVEKAFRKKRLVVEGDLEALARFAACFSDV